MTTSTQTETEDDAGAGKDETAAHHADEKMREAAGNDIPVHAEAVEAKKVPRPHFG